MKMNYFIAAIWFAGSILNAISGSLTGWFGYLVVAGFFARLGAGKLILTSNQPVEPTASSNRLKP